MKTIQLPFVIEPQQESRLCWAAVSIAIASFYKSSKSGDQISFAKSVFGEKYNQFCAPNHALSTLGIFQETINRPMTKEEISIELEHHRPIAACMKHFVGWHLVVIYGINGDTLLIADSLLGNTEWDIKTFTSKYHKNYHWTHSYKTKKQTIII